METKSDALVDRIRAVEDKLEKGIPMAMPAGGFHAGAGYASEGSAESAKAPVKRELPKALPEEIKDIVSKWPAIVATADGFLKNQLKHAKLSLSTDDKLLLIVEDGISSDYFSLDGKKQEVDTLISNYMQREVEVTIQSISPNRDFSDEYVDLSQFIMTEIEEEEE
jgi:DNA polymerase-3 subunit gamma/tau